ncbi:ankyrin repeat domain-containing protein [Promicromonospora iranensis]|uniref:Ankyrin repeat protein n=1 Tax=Promicromonospora iranensis TaxID=1105144 RepID=A0ABU2CKZ5_9MICO|nr:ankyrin repeat domain-containing protein [Promicromonospora iranensis]MDR7382005.1 ankyrin repeat protein [Promicromonospora iranensis]
MSDLDGNQRADQQGTSDTEAGTRLEPQQIFDLARQGADVLLDLVDAGLPVDLADEADNTLLMLAAYHGHAAVTAGLAERGADVNRLNGKGQAPLAGAVFKNEADVIRVLVEHGADPEAGNPSARATAQMFGRELPEPGAR